MTRTKNCVAALSVLLAALLLPASLFPQGSGGRLAVQTGLEQRYRLTVIGPALMGFRGGRDTIQRAGGVVSLRQSGLHGSLNPNQPASFGIREGTATFFRGSKDVPLPAGGKFFVHSVHVGSDVVTLGLLSTSPVAAASGAGRVWLALSFFFPAAALEQADMASVFRVLDAWLAPQESFRPVMTAAPPPAMPPPASAPAVSPTVAELEPGMSRDEVESALGAPQREVSFGARSWLTYPGMVVLLEEEKVVSVDRSRRPPGELNIVSDPEGADVLLDGEFVGSTPARLELPAGKYRIVVRLEGYGAWEREVRVLAGSQVTLRARLASQ